MREFIITACGAQVARIPPTRGDLFREGASLHDARTRLGRRRVARHPLVTEGTRDSTTAEAFIALASGRKGHFKLESGHHSGLWLDLDAVFAEPRRVMPFIAALTTALQPYGVTMVCGPLLGGAFVAQLIAHALNVDFCFTERVMPADNGGLFQAQYRLPAAFRERLRGQRVAIVDDVVSAGSALRGTCSELQSHGANPVVAGALLVLGSTGEDYFTQRQIRVEAVARRDFDLWLPSECPLCTAGLAVEGVAAPVA